MLDLLPVELQGEAAEGPAARGDAIARFCRGLIDAAAPACVAVKPQLAFFEAFGSHGIRAFEETCAYAREAGLLVIADAKRGDIGSTARAYAAAYLEPRDDGPPLADAITLNAYLGRESVEPFLAACKREGGGIFVVTKTSNVGSRRRAGSAPARRRASSGTTSRSSRASGARTSSASAGCRASGS